MYMGVEHFPLCKEFQGLYMEPLDSQLRGQTGFTAHLTSGKIMASGDKQGIFLDCHEDYGGCGTLPHLKFEDEMASVTRFLCDWFMSLASVNGTKTPTAANLASELASTGFQREEDTSEWFGFGAKTENFTFLFNLDYDPGDKPDDFSAMSWECWIYETKWLREHMTRAKAGIRFIDSGYNELFTISDGGSVELHTKPGEVPSVMDGKTVRCRYIDSCHLLYGRSIYHICELAEMLERQKLQVEPALAVYSVELTEIRRVCALVEARGSEAAMKKAMEMYKDGKLNLDFAYTTDAEVRPTRCEEL